MNDKNPNEDKLIGGKKMSEINLLKKQHGSVFLIEVIHPSTNETSFFWFKKPDMQVLSASAMYVDAPFKMGKILFTNLLIEGDEEATKDVVIFPAIVGELAKTIKQVKASIKEF